MVWLLLQLKWDVERSGGSLDRLDVLISGCLLLGICQVLDCRGPDPISAISSTLAILGVQLVEVKSLRKALPLKVVAEDVIEDRGCVVSNFPC